MEGRETEKRKSCKERSKQKKSRRVNCIVPGLHAVLDRRAHWQPPGFLGPVGLPIHLVFSALGKRAFFSFKGVHFVRMHIEQPNHGHW